jgi:hypothetical protein
VRCPWRSSAASSPYYTADSTEDLPGRTASALGGGDVPPLPVAIGAGILGLITIVAAIPGWRGRRAARLTVIVARVVSAATTLPAFFVPDVPAAARIVAAVVVVLAVAVVGLVVAATVGRPSAAPR